jgi:hypothetical protein
MYNDSESTHNRSKRRFLLPILIPFLFLALAAIVMFLWNAILPDIIHTTVINYWQALGLLAICRILFGGFGHHGNRNSHYFARSREMKEKWMKMTDEEKQKFREEWKERCEHRHH